MRSRHQERFENLLACWSDGGHAAWCDKLRASSTEILQLTKNGHMPKWEEAIADLPSVEATHTNFNAPAVTFDGPCSEAEREKTQATLKTFHPWRKGPFELFGVKLDTEWRSDLKWQRVAPHVELDNKEVLDVGCGNGYYGWRMLGAGARRVVGLEPYPLYNMQSRIFENYAPNAPNYVLAANDRLLSRDQPKFDVTFSMGVLYHCKNPIGHVESLRHAMKSGGTLVLETLVVDGDAQCALIPGERYAKMRNVWLIPSALMLEQLVRRCGFREVEVVDVTATTVSEQRRTDWMTFESLADFLHPDDASKTIEGYPAPKRAILIARGP